jgi:acyl carrier protein
MGLDAVEIVVMVEEAFDIAIENAEAEKLLTPRDVIEYVMRKVGRTDRAQCLTQRAFHRVREALMRNAGFVRSQIRPEVPTRILFPVARRRELLCKTLNDIGITATPELVRPNWLVSLLFTASVAVGLAAMFWSALSINSKNLFLAFLTASPAMTGVAAATVCAWAATKLTIGMKHEFKPALANVGGFSRWVLAHGTEILGAPPGQWSHQQVADRVRMICIEVLDCERTYREDANFVEDLGLD